MPQQTWIFGSDPTCDIVVDNTTVSSQHCRLEMDGEALTLTDLDSTNGTFVNGKRLSGSLPISATDRITLGQSQPMPWPEGVQANHTTPEPKSSAEKTQVITIGRAADNAVAIDEANVSTHHARLTIDGDSIVLEDLGSTNGTSVGKVENKISRVNVKRSDTVFFGSTPAVVSDLIAQTEPTYVKPSTEIVVDRQRSPTPAMLTALAGVGATALLILLGWFALRDQKPANPPQIAEPNVPAVPEKVAVAMPATPPTIPTDPKQTGTSDELTPQQKLASSLFVIVCSDEEGKTPFRVGTGFAIDSEHVVTSAAVIQAMKRLQENGFPKTLLFSPANNSELAIASATTHPQYDAANKAAMNAQQKHDGIFDDLESKPPTPESFEAVKDQLLDARNKAMQSIERKTTYDVGIIKVDQPVEHWLSIATSDVSLRPNQKVNVTGYAFDVEDPYFDRSAPIELATLASRVSTVMKLTEDSAPRMLAKGASEQHEYAYLGSPALNAQGQVVGVYSRPAPSDAASEQKAATDTFDAALFQRIGECLSGQP